MRAVVLEGQHLWDIRQARKDHLVIRLSAVTRKLLIVLLVLLVLLVALPLGMGMGMAMCSTSHSSVCPSAAGVCAAIVGLMVLVLFGILGTLRDRTPLTPVLLLAHSLERPPRFFSP